jgi:hypothetical protein
MIEILLILSFLFLIYAFFYKQTTNEYTITQITFLNIGKLQELLYDKIPIVIKDAPVPQCIQPNIILSTPRFSTILGNYIIKKEVNIPSSSEFETYIANETGFQVFNEHYWHSYFYTNFASPYISSIKSKLCFGSKALNTTTAIYTIIMPVVGNYICSLINNEFTKELPTNTITSIEQLNNIQYIDVILKPNTILILPPHWNYIMNEKEEYSYYGIIEYHEPISLLMNSLAKKK